MRLEMADLINLFRSNRRGCWSHIVTPLTLRPTFLTIKNSLLPYLLIFVHFMGEVLMAVTLGREVSSIYIQNRHFKFWIFRYFRFFKRVKLLWSFSTITP
jgi:hypothetical protein